MSKVPVALQLFSVRGECAKDLAGAIKAVAQIGYQGVEPWGYKGGAPEWMGWSGRDLRALLDDHGLTCCGMHLATDALLGPDLETTIQLNQELGNKFLIIAADRNRMSAEDSILELASILNNVAEKLKPLGMFTGYHAHGFDFNRVGDRTAWDILFSNTEKEVVMQMDIGNCASGGGDPVAILERFPGRAKTVHLKEYGGAEGAVIGEGEADWPRIFELCEREHATRWYVVEEGGKDGLRFDIPARSFQALKQMGKC